jgi:hypothetical protein
MKTPKPITPQLRQFLNELADLLEKHRTTFCAVEDSRGYATTTEGFEFSQSSEWDSDANLTRNFCEATFMVGTSEVDAERLRKFTREAPCAPVEP